MANAVIEMLKKQRERLNQEQAAKFLETIKPLDGRHTYRFLPSWDGSGTIFQDFGQHWIPTKSGKKTSVICHRKTFGDDRHCEVCDAIGSAIRNASTDEEIETLKSMYASKRYLANVVVRSDKANADKVQLLEFGQTVYDQLEGLMLAGFEQDESFDITDEKEGWDILISRSGRGMDTNYTVSAAIKSSTYKAKAPLIDIRSEVEVQAAKSSKAALENIAIAVGALPPTIESRAQKALSDLREVEEDDVPFDVVEHEASSDGLTTDDLDALDDLLD